MFLCSFEDCGRYFSRSSKLEIHLRSHTGERPFKCHFADCDKSFIRSDHLHRHLRSHDPSSVNDFPCSFDGCDKKFRLKHHLSRHEKTHLKPFPFVCTATDCGKSFAKKSQLKAHVSDIHNLIGKASAYVCTRLDCGKSFNSPSELKYHQISIHESGGRFICGHLECSGKRIRFDTKKELNLHISEFHSKDVPCDVCGKTFSSRKNMRYHKRLVHPPDNQSYICEQCGKAFRTRDYLKKHVKHTHSLQVLTCGKCGKAFSFRSSLKKHEQKYPKCNEPEISTKKRRISEIAEKTNDQDFAAMLTGESYRRDKRKTLACPIHGCLFVFTREYDLLRHLMSEKSHGKATELVSDSYNSSSVQTDTNATWTIVDTVLGIIPNFSSVKRPTDSFVSTSLSGFLPSYFPNGVETSYKTGFPLLMIHGGVDETSGGSCSSNVYIMQTPMTELISNGFAWQWRNLSVYLSGSLPPALYGHKSAIIFQANSIDAEKLYFVIFGGWRCDNDLASNQVYLLSLMTLEWRPVTFNDTQFQAWDIDAISYNEAGLVAVYLESTGDLSLLTFENMTTVPQMNITTLTVSNPDSVPGIGWGHAITFIAADVLILSGGFGFQGNSTIAGPKYKIWQATITESSVLWSVQNLLANNGSTFSLPGLVFHSIISMPKLNMVTLVGGLFARTRISLSTDLRLGVYNLMRFTNISNGEYQTIDYLFQPTDSPISINTSNFHAWSLSIEGFLNHTYLDALVASDDESLALISAFNETGSFDTLEMVSFNVKTSQVKSSAETTRESGIIIAIIVLSVISTVLVVGVFAFCLYKKRMNSYKHNGDFGVTPTSDNEPELTHVPTEDIYVPKYQLGDMNSTLVQSPESSNVLVLPGFRQMQADVDYQTKKKITGSGEAIIHLGKILTKQFLDCNNSDPVVAIKIPKKKSTMSTNFRQEIAIIWMFNSKKNFIKLVGYSESPPAMIMRYYKLGSLRDLIAQKGELKIRDKSWSLKTALLLAKDCANALKEMHEVGIVHGDIKTPNVLLDIDVDNQLFAVFSDFGIASVVDKSLLAVKGFQVSKIRGASIIYAAPEALARYRKSKYPPSDKSVNTLKASDVYSFGMILFELVLRETPWKEYRSREDVETAIIGGLKPEIHPRSTLRRAIETDPAWKELLDMADSCWNFTPKTRPKAQDILNQLTFMERRFLK